MSKIFQILYLLLGIVLIHGQTLSSTLDKNTVGLGEKGVFIVRVQNLEGKAVQSAPKNELLPFHFEEITDVEKLQNDAYERKIEFQIFEEGEFTIPPLEFKVGETVLRTIPYTIKAVNQYAAEDEIEDIVGNKEVKLSWSDYWEMYKWYVLLVLMGIALIVFAVGLYKYFSKPKDTPKVWTNQTLKALEQLRKKNYISKGETRQFYVELIDLMRNFILVQYKISADVLLTEDLVAVMRESNVISKSNETRLEEVLKMGDQVKFAKIFPHAELMEKHWEMMRQVVKDSLKDVETEQLRSGV